MKTVLLLASLFAFAVSTKGDDAFLIRHTGGLCAYATTGYHQYIKLSSSCQQYFKSTPQKKLQHVKTKKCVSPIGIWNGAPLALVACSSTTAQFKMTVGHSIQHINSGKCVHPLGGKTKPKSNTLLVIHSGCNIYRLSFNFEQRFVMKHYGGLCAYNAKNYIKLSSSCNETFIFTSKKKLQHLTTKKCVAPVGKMNEAPLKLVDCFSTTAQFKRTPGFSIQHINSGKCVHPFGGKAEPERNTNLVAYSGCDLYRLSFHFQYQSR